MAGDEADVFLVTGASRDPGDHLAANDDGTGRVFVPQLRIGHGRIPRELPRPRVNGDDVRVVGRGEDLVSVDGDVSLDTAPLITTAAWGLRQPRDGTLFCCTTTQGGRT